MHRYKLCRCILSAVSAVFFLASCAAKPNTAKYTDNKPSDAAVTGNSEIRFQPQVPNGMTEIVKKGRLVLYADMSTAEFAVADCFSGKIWYSNPPDYEDDKFAKGAFKRWMQSQLLVNDIILETNTVKTKNSYVSSVMKETAEIKADKDGILVTYKFSDEGYEIPLKITLLSDSLTASVDMDKIKENGEEKILSIQLLPFFGAQSSQKSGYMLIGDGSGAVINFNNGKTQGVSPYITQIYGSDPAAVEEQRQNKREKSALPIYGMQLSDGGGMLAICERGAGCGYIVSSVSGIQTSYNRSCFEFELRRSQTVSIGDTTSGNYRDVVCYADNIPAGSLSVRYFFLSDGEDGLGGMAETARSWLKNNGGFKEKNDKSAPIYISVLGAVRRKTSVLGLSVEKNEALTTINDALEITEELEKNNVAGIRLLYDGSGVAQLENKISGNYEIWSGLGNKKQLLKLSEHIKSTDGRLYIKLPAVYFSRGGNGYSAKKHGIRNMNKATVEIPEYARNTFFPMTDKETFSVLRSDYAAGLVSELADYFKSKLDGIGILPISYTDTVYSDFGKGGFSRNINENQIADTALKASKTVLLSGETPIFAAIPALTDITSLPSGATEYRLVDYSVPFYQMIIHGSVSYGTRPINADGDPDYEYLMGIAYGAAPHYEITAKNTSLLKQAESDSYYGSDYSYWKATVVAQYSRYSELWEKTHDSAIVDFKILSDGMLCTVYENGIKTVVNLSDEDKTYNGVNVPAKDFIVPEAM